jgi:hypothetical protein
VKLLKILFSFFAVAAVLAMFTDVAFQKSNLKAKVATCEAALASARENAATAATKTLDDCQQCEAHGRVEGYQQAQKDHEEVKRETEKLAKPKCDPMTPPFFPCCGEAAEPFSLDEVRPEDFRNGRTLTLSCARTANSSPEQGSPWVCARTEERCARSKQRSGACSTCYVHLSSGVLRHEPSVWTGHAVDEMDGPWTADGKRGVFP